MTASKIPQMGVQSPSAVHNIGNNTVPSYVPKTVVILVIPWR